MTIRVCIHDTRDGPIGGGGTVYRRDMPAVPRVGDMIFLSEDHPGIEVRRVLWTPYPDNSRDYDVQIRGW